MIRLRKYILGAFALVLTCGVLYPYLEQETPNEFVIKSYHDTGSRSPLETMAIEKLLQNNGEQFAAITTQGPIDTSDPAYRAVNKDVSLGNYVPADLATLDRRYANGAIQVSSRIVSDLTKMIDKAKLDGIDLKVISGFRSIKTQESLFNLYTNIEMRKNRKLSQVQAEEIVNTYSARPGHSEHQLGTTVDLGSKENGYTFEMRANLKYVEWIERHAKDFNFRISYGKDNREYQYEPWHIRWYPS